MKIKYCSITGADDAVEVGDLSALSVRFSFAEWAVLLMPSRAGAPQFPKVDWIRNFAKNGRGYKAMHLCADALLGFVAGDKEILDLMQGYDRIQLNLKFGAVEGKYDPSVLVARAKSMPQHQFIVQYTPDKKPTLDLFKDVENHAVLFDESAGRGISPDLWSAPLPGHFCGYAGGINPDNVEKNLQMIAQVAGDYTTWIDMESGVRTDDVFDLGKVDRVLTACTGYV